MELVAEKGARKGARGRGRLGLEKKERPRSIAGKILHNAFVTLIKE
jgi:hypothetical protein